MLYPGYGKASDIIRMPAITFFALLKEGANLEIVNMKNQLAVVSYPYMKEDDQQQFRDTLVLPEDILNDILEDDDYDDISKVRAVLEGNDGN